MEVGEGEVTTISTSPKIRVSDEDISAGGGDGDGGVAMERLERECGGDAEVSSVYTSSVEGERS